MAFHMSDERKYLDPSVLARIGGLELRARLVVQGFFSGMHRSPYQGLAVEFAAHREYAQGDDIRHIDWKVFGRTDKYYLKEYEQETNLNCLIVVDQSESMHYSAVAEFMSKYDYAASLAASFAYLAGVQRDSVGLAVFDDRIRAFVKSSTHPQQWRTIVKELSEPASRQEKTSIRAVLHDLADRLPKRHLIVLLSDLFDDPDEILLGLKRLRYARHEVIVANVWDWAELSFPFKGPTEFVGLEGTGRLMTDPEAIRERYLAELETFISTMRNGCRRMHMDYATFGTTTPLDVGLSSYLSTRSRSIRQRSSRVMGRR
jgi:uncharacterized protein (DUF58 family)